MLSNSCSFSQSECTSRLQDTALRSGLRTVANPGDASTMQLNVILDLTRPRTKQEKSWHGKYSARPCCAESGLHATVKGMKDPQISGSLKHWLAVLVRSSEDAAGHNDFQGMPHFGAGGGGPAAHQHGEKSRAGPDEH